MAARPTPLWAGCLALAGVGAVGYCLADRRRPAWWILLAVETTQTCLHLWFAWCTSTAPGPGPTHMSMRPGGMHMSGGTGMAHVAGITPGMLAAHTLAGCLAAIWLYAGERALWRALQVIVGFLVDRTLILLALLCRPGPPFGCGVRAVVGRGEDELAAGTAALRHVLVRRGPPRFCGFSAIV